MKFGNRDSGRPTPAAANLTADPRHPHNALRCVRNLVAPFLLATIACVATTTPGSGRAEPVVYANWLDSPEKPGTIFYYAVPIDTNETPFYLYVDAGLQPPTQGTPCIDGNGENICAYEIDLEALGDMTFNDTFVGEPGVVWERIDDRHISIVFAEPSAPSLGPQRVASFSVETAGDPGSVRLAGGGIVVGELSWQEWEAEDIIHIAAPEPGFPVALWIAVALLAILCRSSRTRRTPTSRFKWDRSPLGRMRRWRTYVRTIPCALAIAQVLVLGLVSADIAEAADPSVEVSGRWINLSAGLDHTCGIVESGEIVCFGEDGSLTNPSVSGAPTGAFKRLSTGDEANCAVRVDGDILCWGGDDAAC